MTSSIDPNQLSTDTATSGAQGSGARCDGNAQSLGAYFMEGRRVSVRCSRAPIWRVFVNPPRPGDDGTKLVCSLCAGFDWNTFRREPYDSAALAAVDGRA